ncbi:MAG: universal stress protein [Deltaproteobacteria bacterium]|nr:universal stress protein [Deltaproteobacteria bacterium]MBW1969924.1 universal stress protein [Deltaproteobacteria bacterium]MBW2157692.1 universal stress protein [Deltaproteobacteria bacterium]MBW2198874.1 universal stress protein [Deltaproteobacteria bacterium]MBW2228572.1 universal stress protein [Deltaproteobacteria bacterium]
MEPEEMACPITRGEKILVAVDGSKYTDIIVDQAISMGRICNSVIVAISVIPFFPEYVSSAVQLEEELSKNTRKLLETVKRRIEKENIACETLVRIDDQPHEPIVQEARKRNVDLIVIGTRGVTGLKRVLMGSVAQKVIGHAPCPVMVVPV